MKNRDMNKYLEKFNMKFTEFLSNSGGYVIFGVAAVAIVLAIVGFYMQNGFEWKWFLFLHLPLYVFCGWALAMAFREYRKALKNLKNRK